MQIASEILGFLETGQGLSFENIVSKCSFPECNVELVLNFLTKFDFLQVDEKKRVFRLHPDMVSLSNRLQGTI